MAELRKSTGLCGTCDDDRGCTFPRASGSGVVFCEEFAPEGADPRPPRASKAPASPRRAPDARLGLCGNCDDVKTCTVPCAREGVVHCEEHR